MTNQDSSARFFGYVDGRTYEPCDANYYHFSEVGEAEYREGYGQAMDMNLNIEGGIAPYEDRPFDECTCCRASVTPNNHRVLCFDCFNEAIFQEYD